ncbi:hypothetical protein [Desulfobacterium sp. N47]|uniref:Uncharacterized protein n=1 Tax=uncultured Desulfobacterium sp. TaxID=201089 RepID=E1YA07_9BACT|nr:unknown protein [uncultured Desulfobacterium sp.]
MNNLMFAGIMFIVFGIVQIVRNIQYHDIYKIHPVSFQKHFGKNSLVIRPGVNIKLEEKK